MHEHFEFSLDTMKRVTGNGDNDLQYQKWFIEQCEVMCNAGSGQLAGLVDGRFAFDRNTEADSRASLARVRFARDALTDCAEFFSAKGPVAERFLVANKRLEDAIKKAEIDFSRVLKLLSLS